MSFLTIDISDDGLLQMLRRLPQTQHHHLEQGLDRIGQEYAREMRRNAPEAFGHLRNSTRMEVTGPLERKIAPHMDYARPVDEGTGPGGAPSLRTISDWARRKRLVPMPGDTERDMAWKIRRAIARRGTPKQPFFTNAAESTAMRSRALKLLADAAQRGLDEAAR